MSSYLSSSLEASWYAAKRSTHAARLYHEAASMSNAHLRYYSPPQSQQQGCAHWCHCPTRYHSDSRI